MPTNRNDVPTSSLSAAHRRRRHLDYDDSGLLDETEVLALYRVFDPFGAAVANGRHKQTDAHGLRAHPS